MQYSVGVEYAFHTLFYMVELPPNKVIGIRPLAKLHGVSETYLSKIFTKLKKAGLIHSTPGAKGGYRLSRSSEHISFWDIVEAVEGPSTLFQCAEIRQNNLLNEEDLTFSSDCPCLIKVVMTKGEEKMREYLKTKSLAWLYREVYEGFREKKKEAITNWLKENMS